MFASGGDGMLKRSQYTCNALNFMGTQRVEIRHEGLNKLKRLEDDAVNGHYWSQNFECTPMPDGPQIASG